MAKKRKPTIDALRALRLYAETGSVSETARRLEVTQPVVSRKLQVFEDPQACGSVLLRRKGLHLQLTESATSVLPAINELVDRYDRVLAYLRGDGDAPRVLRIGAGNFSAEHYLPAALAAVQEMTEECKVETRICRGGERILRTAKGDFQMSLVTHNERQIRELLRDEQLPEGVLQVTSLGKDSVCLAAQKDSEAGAALADLPASKPIAINQLCQWELIGPDRQSGLRQQLESRSTEPLYFVCEGGGWSAAKRYAANGLGAALLPQAIVSRSDSKALICRPLAKDICIQHFLVHRATPLDGYEKQMKKAILDAFRKPA